MQLLRLACGRGSIAIFQLRPRHALYLADGRGRDAFSDGQANILVSCRLVRDALLRDLGFWAQVNRLKVVFYPVIVDVFSAVHNWTSRDCEGVLVGVGMRRYQSRFKRDR